MVYSYNQKKDTEYMDNATYSQTQFEWLFTAFIFRTLKSGEKLGIEIPKDVNINKLNPTQFSVLFKYGDSTTRDKFISTATNLFDTKIKFVVGLLIGLSGFASLFLLALTPLMSLIVGGISGWCLGGACKNYKKSKILYTNLQIIGSEYLNLAIQKIEIQLNNQAIYEKWAEEEKAEQIERDRFDALVAAKKPSNFS